MIAVAKDWNPGQNRLKELLSTEKTREAVELCLSMHASLHDGRLGCGKSSYLEVLKAGLSEPCFRRRPESKFASIAWNLYHITRIEDAVSSILIADRPQVWSGGRRERTGSPVSDTGNAMEPNEVDSLSAALDMEAFFEYRHEVALRTREILMGLTGSDLKRRPDGKRLARLLEEGVLLEDGRSKWLLDFWGKKTVAGLLLMPITRHQVVHLNDCLKLKAGYGKLCG